MRSPAKLAPRINPVCSLVPGYSSMWSLRESVLSWCPDNETLGRRSNFGLSLLTTAVAAAQQHSSTEDISRYSRDGSGPGYTWPAEWQRNFVIWYIDIQQYTAGVNRSQIDDDYCLLLWDWCWSAASSISTAVPRLRILQFRVIYKSFEVRATAAALLLLLWIASFSARLWYYILHTP